jgi:hypothetical protein
MGVFRELLGPEYDQGPPAFINVLLLLKDVFKTLHLQTLELRTVYHNT